MADNTDNVDNVDNVDNGVNVDNTDNENSVQLHSVLEQVKAEKMSIDDAVNQLKKNPHDMKNTRRQKPRFFVTTTGSVGVRGIKSGSPLILYKDQWDAITRLVHSGHLENFMEKNDNMVKKKNLTFNMSKLGEELPEE